MMEINELNGRVIYSEHFTHEGNYTINKIELVPNHRIVSPELVVVIHATHTVTGTKVSGTSDKFRFQK